MIKEILDKNVDITFNIAPPGSWLEKGIDFKSFMPKFLSQAADIVIKDIRDGILASKGIDGNPLPALEPETIERKSGLRKVTKGLRGAKPQSDIKTRTTFGIEKEYWEIYRKGKYQKAERRFRSLSPTKPLLDTGNLLNSPRKEQVIKTGKGWEITIALGKQRAVIGYYLQVEGIGGRKKKFYFMGVSEPAKKKITTLLEIELAKMFK